jgi:hypothetical protein
VFDRDYLASVKSAKANLSVQTNTMDDRCGMGGIDPSVESNDASASPSSSMVLEKSIADHQETIKDKLLAHLEVLVGYL